MAVPRSRRFPAITAALGLLLVAAACAPAGTSSTQSAAASSGDASESAAASSGASESAAASGDGSGAATVTITGSSSFGADELTVAAGEDVTVINNSSVSHTFTEGQNGGEADEPVVNETIPSGAQAVVQFPDPGDYEVTCLFHSNMNMVVHVE
jgi:plastocyanin